MSSQLALITFVGYRENAGHKLISESSARDFERDWRAEVRAASAAELAEEADLLRVLAVAKSDAPSDESALEIPKLPTLTLAILKTAQTEVKSFAFGSRAVHHAPRLHWTILTDLFGSEEGLKHRINELKATAPKGEDELLALVDKYVGGWRPDMEEP